MASDREGIAYRLTSLVATLVVGVIGWVKGDLPTTIVPVLLIMVMIVLITFFGPLGWFG